MRSADAWRDYLTTVLAEGGVVRHNVRSADLYAPVGAPPPPDFVNVVRERADIELRDLGQRTDAPNGVAAPPDLVAEILRSTRRWS